MKDSIHVLLDSLIDYAGLFPPASLPLAEAVRKYDEYRRGKFAWTLGRFVVPAKQAGEVPPDFPLSVLATPDEIPDAHVVEVKAASGAEIEKIAKHATGRTVYVEISDVSLLDPIAQHRLRAKIRTGGTTPEAFPGIEQLATFIFMCRQKKIPFKATAGLHHPIRCSRPLTYETNAPVALMHGFINVFVAAALPGSSSQILREENARAFGFDDGGMWFRDLRVTTDELERVRKQSAISFGSCSFEEPIAELQELGWL